MANPEGSAEAQDGHLREPLRESGHAVVEEMAEFGARSDKVLEPFMQQIKLSKYLAYEWNNIRSNNVAPWVYQHISSYTAVSCITAQVISLDGGFTVYGFQPSLRIA
ncbi:hypothetical protein ACSQ67_002155 [Phaseolus vulgaris]